MEKCDESCVCEGEKITRNHGVALSEDGAIKPARVQRVKSKKHRIPEEITENAALNDAIALLPSNYNFEIHKTVWRIVSERATIVAVQFPEGLLLYACIISDILTKFCNVQVIILGDVTYGACCIDDFTAAKLGAELIVHYGHSCLVPISSTKISTMYVFIEISFDIAHLVDCIQTHFPPSKKIALMGTIQFVSMLHATKDALIRHNGSYSTCLSIPQSKPLSMGETLGCTSPHIDAELLVFVADGRFHLEAAMISNPHVTAYRYDPYNKKLTAEAYDVAGLKVTRYGEIVKARSATVFGVVLGTLGRQGNNGLFNRIVELLRRHGKVVIPFLMAEINPVKLAAVTAVEVWVQIACPRLSIDWGTEYPRPILTSYELQVSLSESEWQDTYPMDYYSATGGSWTNAGANRPAAAPTSAADPV